MMFQKLVIGGIGLSVLLVAPEGNAIQQDAGQAKHPEEALARVRQEKHEHVVLVKVGTYEITAEEFMQFLSRNAIDIQKALTPPGKASLLRTIIANRLLDEALRKEGFLNNDKPTKQEYLAAYKKLEDKYFPLPPAPDEKSAYQFYQEHESAFGIPAMVRVSQIQFRYPDNLAQPKESDKAAAKQRAEAALRRLESGEPFAQLAGELTENPKGKVTQGDLGFLPRDRDPWLRAALQGLEVGKHTGILESPVGYEILKLTEERKALISPFPNVRDRVVQAMQQDEKKKRLDAYLRKLAQSTKIEIIADELKPEFAKGVFP